MSANEQHQPLALSQVLETELEHLGKRRDAPSPRDQELLHLYEKESDQALTALRENKVREGGAGRKDPEARRRGRRAVVRRALAGLQKGSDQEGRSVAWVDASAFYLLPARVRTCAPQGKTVGYENPVAHAAARWSS
jgi:hypothetical protein